MKKKPFSNFLKMTAIFMMMAVVVASCKKDDDPKPDPEPLVEDGIYVVGAGTALTTFDIKGLMKSTKNEVDQSDRAALLELYIPVKAGADGFNIVKVAGSTKTTYGPGADFAVVTTFGVDEPKTGKFSRGSIAETATKFTVAEDGLYHVVYDTELGKVVVAKAEWGVIGGATPLGWGGSTEMPATFDLNKMEFTTTELTLKPDIFKFRYNNGWKIHISADSTVKVNTNFGGTLNALVPGGADIANTEYAIYTLKLTYELGKGFSATQVKTGDAEPLPTYPEAMFLVGDATAYGWATPGENAEAIMHKLAGGGDNDGIFWKIASLEAGLGFKLSAANWANPNLGFNEVNEFDVDGVVVTEAGGNMSVATSGMYVFVLDLRNDTKKLSVREASVYGIGDAFGSWDAGVEAYKFTINNETKTLVSPALNASANVRMYAAHPWIPAWWNAEFNVFSGKIEYRNDGGDQEAVPGTAGQTVTLHFDDNTGSIQ